MGLAFHCVRVWDWFIHLMFWLRWGFVALHGLSLAVASQGSLPCSAWASHRADFPWRGARALGHTESAAVAHGLSCSWQVGSSWTRDRTSIPGVARRLLTTGPAGKALAVGATCCRVYCAAFCVVESVDAVPPTPATPATNCPRTSSMPRTLVTLCELLIARGEKQWADGCQNHWSGHAHFFPYRKCALNGMIAWSAENC